MKLIDFHVWEYKSVNDSNAIKVEDVTCLVGKNESGKTSLLKALYKLNPIIPEYGTYDVVDEYPRAEVEDYRQAIEAGQRKVATVVLPGKLLEIWTTVGCERETHDYHGSGREKER